MTKTSRKKITAKDDSDLTRGTNFVLSNRRPEREAVVVQSAKDADNIAEVIKPLPTDCKNMSKVFENISSNSQPM